MYFHRLYSMEALQFRGKPSLKAFTEALFSVPRNPVVFNSGMWNGMLFHEAQIPDTYLFAHSSLLDNL